MLCRILVIAPGSTSTKICVYENEKEIMKETVMYSSTQISKYDRIYDQFQFRNEDILNTLKKKAVNLNTLNAVVGRGGLLKLEGSEIYRVNKAMIEDLKAGIQGEHASNLGGIIADSIAAPLNIPAFIVNSVTIDELEDIARISGMPEITRKSKFHGLNQKVMAKKYAMSIGKNYLLRDDNRWL